MVWFITLIVNLLWLFGLVVDVFSRTCAWGPGLELLLWGPMLTVLKNQVKQEIPDSVFTARNSGMSLRKREYAPNSPLMIRDDL